MRKIYLTLLIGFILIANFSGCMRTNDQLSPTPNMEGIDLSGGVCIVLTPKTTGSKMPSEEQYETAKSVISYRLKGMGYENRNVTVDDSGNFVVEIASDKDINDSDIARVVENISKTGKFTIQEIVESNMEAGTYLPTDKVVVSGTDILDAELSFSAEDVAIVIELNENATMAFEEATERLVGERLGIFLDNRLLFAPIINEKITGRKVMISVPEGEEEALDLLTIIMSGRISFELEQTSIEK